MSNVIEFPKIFDVETPQGVAKALGEYIKDRPSMKLLVILKDEEAQELNIGFSKMEMQELIFMIEFARNKWSQLAFEGSEIPNE